MFNYSIIVYILEIVSNIKSARRSPENEREEYPCLEEEVEREE